jgi:2-aminoethylphosphonate-pyruvate transaminase
MNLQQTAPAPKLLNPGPVTLTSRVRAALTGVDLCHREPEFAALQSEIRRRLIGVYPQAARDYTAVLLAGSGTAAVEAMVGTFVPRQGHALVVANGVYGERMAAMLAAQGKTAHTARAAWTEPMDLLAAERLLAGEPRITHVLAVQHETTTGRLNNIAALGALCRRFDKPLLLDAVSSFGAEELDFENWNLAACAATANKCLHGVPGVSFVLARRDALAAESGATSLYLDLSRYYAEQEKGSTPFTMPVQVCYALAEALRELEDAGGWRARRAHYAALSALAFAGLQSQGVAPLLDIAAPSSPVLTAYRIPTGPAGLDYASLHTALKAAGFVIYAGQGQFQHEIFRIAVMGDLAAADIERLLTAFAQWRQRQAAQARGGSA